MPDERHPCEYPGCTEPGYPCSLNDDLLAEPQRVTEYLCATHASERGYCWGCGRFWAGVESFDFRPSGLCDDCQAERDYDAGADEEEDEDGFGYDFDDEEV